MPGAPHGDVMQWLGAAALVLSFALLCRRRAGAALDAVAAQSWVLAAAAAWQGWAHGSGALAAAALVILVGPGIAVPRALRPIVRGVEAGPGGLARLAAGLALVALAVAVVLPTAAPMREDLALALSVVLLGLLTMLARRTVLGQVIGFLSLGNGVGLAAVGAQPAALPTALLAPLALVLPCLLVLHLHAGRAGG